jgi:hypothetical protein
LLAAHAALAVAQETRGNAERLAEVTASFVKREVRCSVFHGQCESLFSASI